MPALVHIAVRLSKLDVDALQADDLTGYARALFHMLALLTHEEAAVAGKKSVPVRVSPWR